MTDYEFTLRFSLPDSNADPEGYIDALAAACNDALIGVGQRGRIALTFARTSESAVEAISTALRDVGIAVPGAVLVEASLGAGCFVNYLEAPAGQPGAASDCQPIKDMGK